MKLDEIKTFNEAGWDCCRLTGCPKQSFRCYDYFCQSCHTSFHRSNATRSEELARAYLKQIKRGEDIKLTLKQSLFEQSVKCSNVRDAGLYLEDGAVIVHWTTVGNLANWEGNGIGEIVLIHNRSLKESTLEQYLHFENAHNKSDTFVWGTIDILGGEKIMQ